jgi:hypothetical protein
MKLCLQEVEYVGHRITADGVKIGKDKVKAVLQMDKPDSIDKVRQLLGMVTYTCKFLPNLSDVTEPLRELIKESNEPDFKFHWDEIHEQAFYKLMDMMTKAPVLRFYSSAEPIVISCDASQKGLGAVLMQGGHPVTYASKALTKTEEAYAQIEKEMLAIVFALKKFHTYVYGRRDIVVETDHLPLVRIMEKPLHLTPLRLQKMKMSLQHYDFKLIGKSGKDIPVADALSRTFLPDTHHELLKDVNQFQVFACEVRGANAFSDARWKQLRVETEKDEALQKVKEIIHTGWPKKKAQLDPDVKPFFNARGELTVLEDIVFKADRVVIPKGMRKQMLLIIHEGHQGIVRSKQLARDVLYWPGMNAQIQELIENSLFAKSTDDNSRRNR